MNFCTELKRIRRFLRDPDGKVWDQDLVRETYNHAQQRVAQTSKVLERVKVIRVPSYFNCSYQYDWERQFLDADEKVCYQALRENMNTGGSNCFNWEFQEELGVGSDVSEEGDYVMTQPWESYISGSASIRDELPVPCDHHSTVAIWHDERPLDYMEEKDIMREDPWYVSRQGEPRAYYRLDESGQRFSLHPRPSTVEFNALASDTSATFGHLYDWEANYRDLVFNEFISFNGVDQYLSYPDHANLDIATGDFSFECVFRVNVLGGIVFGKYEDASDHYWLEINDTGGLFWEIKKTGVTGFPFKLTQNGAITIDNWYHVVVAGDRNGVTRLYIDNVVVDTDVTINSDHLGNTATFNVGRRNDGFFYLDGDVLLLRKWSKLLSASEIEELYNSGDYLSPGQLTGGLLTSLDASYYFSDSLFDYSPSGLILMNKGGALFGADTAAREGRVAFNDSDDSEEYLFCWEKDITNDIDTATRCTSRFEMDYEDNAYALYDVDNILTSNDGTQRILSDSDRQIIYGTDLSDLDDENNVLMVYTANPKEIVDPGQESELPEFFRKYVQHEVLADIYSANTDGRIKSLGDYWRYRADVGRQAISRYMANRLQDRDFQLTGQPEFGANDKRLARFPDGFPEVVYV